MPLVAGSMRLWQYRKSSASAPVTQSRPATFNSASSPAGNSSSATKDSRDIHEVRGLKKTWSARSGRPISSQTHSSPSPIRASDSNSSQLLNNAAPSPGAASRALTTSRPTPTPPPMKLPAARQSQLVCSQGLGPKAGCLLMCPPCPKDNENPAGCRVLRACENSGSQPAAWIPCCLDHPGHQTPARRQCRN